MENLSYLFWAFGLIWAFVFGFVLVLISRQRRLDREIETLRATLKEKTGER